MHFKFMWFYLSLSILIYLSHQQINRKSLNNEYGLLIWAGGIIETANCATLIKQGKNKKDSNLSSAKCFPGTIKVFYRKHLLLLSGTVTSMFNRINLRLGKSAPHSGRPKSTII